MKMTILSSALLTLLWLTSCGENNREVKASSDGIINSTVANTGKPGEGVTTGGQPIHLSKAEFIAKVYDYEKNPNEWVYAGDKPCIIDFYADWCKPCKMIAPIMADLAKKYEGEIIVYKINTDEEKELAQAFNIRSIPTILFCPVKGQPQMAQGALPQETFEKVVKEVLLAK